MTGTMKKLGAKPSAKCSSTNTRVHTRMENQNSDAYLFESSAIPANALYQAAKAASSPKKPPALITGGFGWLVESRCR